MICRCRGASWPILQEETWIILLDVTAKGEGVKSCCVSRAEDFLGASLGEMFLPSEPCSVLQEEDENLTHSLPARPGRKLLPDPNPGDQLPSPLRPCWRSCCLRHCTNAWRWTSPSQTYHRLLDKTSNGQDTERPDFSSKQLIEVFSHLDRN
ncbi:hypothetical protein Y1Q_0002492 [Alligator mississippiensis]|uniref:Uncharacterized protein n=1 Tax=Alligator mississippiensis TaxID=8496 RepID=A0A151NC60_ALLMI|nr:hypothetical protein Y1Q_0002492 [Alligator mississippiensis]